MPNKPPKRIQTGATEALEDRLMEAFDLLSDGFVDPREAYQDVDGWWSQVGNVGNQSHGTACGIANSEQLRELRDQCRALAMNNEYAANGLENRVNYIVGSGHTYRAAARKGSAATAELELQVQDVLDEFLYENRWKQRQQEIVRRMDRDGEALLRFFVDRDGMSHVRFVEPDQVVTPSKRANDRAASFGILTEPDDVETVVGYYVDGQLIESGEIQHRKANVDSNMKRGIPLYTPVRKNLRRASKLLRNMSIVAEIQSAIALIRKHRGASRSGVEQFVAAEADVSMENGSHVRHYSQYGPGTILDAPAGLEYDFPAAGLDASAFVTILKAELRAIAARLVMPEFMFTSDASNSNFASTMVAEGPAVKMFERLQAAMVQDDCQVMWRVLKNAAAAGRLPHDVRRLVEIQITPPSLYVRDRLQEENVRRIAHQHGVLSIQTWSQQLGLDYDQEQKNRQMHEESQVVEPGE